MAKKGGLMLVLDGGKPPGGDDYDDDYDDDLIEGDEDLLEEGDAEDDDNPAFDAYAQSALGTDDPERVSALREAIRALQEGL